MNFSDFVVYADESGDHSLTSINPQNPVFVLAFCVFEKRAYIETVVPMVQQLKFDFFGHDCVVLHGHEIRKAHGEFRVLLNAEARQKFMERINCLPFAAEIIFKLGQTSIGLSLERRQRAGGNRSGERSQKQKKEKRCHSFNTQPKKMHRGNLSPTICLSARTSTRPRR